jgi:abortive infection bacteriophage resistance protein
MDNINVPYIVHEGNMARMERSNKRLWIVILVLIILLVSSNIAWLCYENSMEDVTTTNEVTQELDTNGGGDAMINGDVSIGKSKENSENNNQDTQEESGR